jgi:type IV pilus assembly protein PilA
MNITDRLLLRLIRRKQDEGFTLVELIVVIVIIGILAAIAVPSFLGQTNRAREAEGIASVGTLNKAQQAFYLQNGRFAADMTELNAGIPATTTNYTYSTTSTAAGTTSRALSTASLLPGSSLRGYVGLVQLSVNSTTGEASSDAILCESAAGATPVDPPNAQNCGAGQTRR